MEVEIVKVTTSSDRVNDRFSMVDPDKRLFVKEIEEGLLLNTIDVGVHSLKDMPTQLPDGLTVVAFIERDEAADAFIPRADLPIDQKNIGIVGLPPEFRIGTSSLRRKALITHLYSGIKVINMRGNVDSRIKKLESGLVDGLIVAAAGLLRLGIGYQTFEILDKDVFIPAVGQGCVAVEARSDNKEINEIFHALDHRRTRICVECERSFLAVLKSGCQVPAGAYCHFVNNSDSDSKDAEDGYIRIVGFVSSPEGSLFIKDEMNGSAHQNIELGTSLAKKLIEMGGAKIFKELNG